MTNYESFLFTKNNNKIQSTQENTLNAMTSYFILFLLDYNLFLKFFTFILIKLKSLEFNSMAIKY